MQPLDWARPSDDGSGVDERKGCKVLKKCFESAGFRITERYAMQAGARKVFLDGMDPERRVGYEYVTTAVGDRVDFNPEVIAELHARMARGELWIFIADEQQYPTEESLTMGALHFLGRLADIGVRPR